MTSVQHQVPNPVCRRRHSLLITLNVRVKHEQGLYLYTCSSLLFANAADQGPSVAGNVGHVGDRLHLLWIPDAHLRGTFEHDGNVSCRVCVHVFKFLPSFSGDGAVFLNCTEIYFQSQINASMKL